MNMLVPIASIILTNGALMDTYTYTHTHTHTHTDKHSQATSYSPGLAVSISIQMEMHKLPQDVCIHESESVSCSVVSDSLQAHGLQPARLLRPWTSPGKNTGVVCHSLPQGIFPTQGSNPGFPHCRQILYCLSLQGSPCIYINTDIYNKYIVCVYKDICYKDLTLHELWELSHLSEAIVSSSDPGV